MGRAGDAVRAGRLGEEAKRAPLGASTSPGARPDDNRGKSAAERRNTVAYAAGWPRIAANKGRAMSPGAFKPVLVKDDPLDDRRAVPPFAALRAFEAVGRLGGIRRAAQALSIDHAVVSRHLGGLEAWLGVALIDRTRGGGSLTELGQTYHARISRAINDIAESTAELMRRGDDGVLRLCCVPGLASEWLTSRLAHFQRDHPHLEIELHPMERRPRFERRETDLDIRYVVDPSPPEEDGLVSIVIGRPPVLPVASPELLSRLGPFGSVADLLSAPLLHEEDCSEWSIWLRRQGVDAPNQLPGPRLWHGHLTLEAARRGLGIALTNTFLLSDHVERGRLVLVRPPDLQPVVLGDYVLTGRADRWKAPAVVSFRRWIENMASEQDHMPA
jgi:LysR family glycine cleavage system transcriptional activator